MTTTHVSIGEANDNIPNSWNSIFNQTWLETVKK